MRNTPPTGPTGPRRVRSAQESRSATVRAAAAAPSRRQQFHWRREQQQVNLLFLGIGALLLVIALIFAGGIIVDNVMRPNEVVAQVEADSVTAQELVDEMRSQARAIDEQVTAAGRTPNAVQYGDQQKRGLPDQALNTLIDRSLVQQEADRRGLSVTPEEVEAREREFVAQYNAFSNPAPTAEPTATPEGGAATPAAASDPSLTATPFSTATPIPTLGADAYPAALAEFLRRNGLTEAEFGPRVQDIILREKVEDAIGADQVPATQEQVHARHILVPTQDQAQAVLQQLQDGADFAALATQLSTDPGSKSQGGDLGWFSRGVMDKTFEEAAFALQPGQLSAVVATPNGFHVIQTLERDPNRPVPEAQLESLRARVSGDWLSSRRNSPEVKLQLTPSLRDWALARIGVRP